MDAPRAGPLGAILNRAGCSALLHHSAGNASHSCFAFRSHRRHIDRERRHLTHRPNLSRHSAASIAGRSLGAWTAKTASPRQACFATQLCSRRVLTILLTLRWSPCVFSGKSAIIRVLPGELLYLCESGGLAGERTSPRAAFSRSFAFLGFFTFGWRLPVAAGQRAIPKARAGHKRVSNFRDQCQRTRCSGARE